MGTVIDGKQIADEVNAGTKQVVATLPDKPTLAIILIGENADSLRYIKHKQKKADELGMQIKLIQYDATTDASEVIVTIEKLNVENDIHGILMQLPLPDEFIQKNAGKGDVTRVITEHISPAKDVDGLTYQSIAKYVTDDSSGFVPATALGVMRILEHIGYALEGKSVIVIGRSMVVGKPASMLLSKQNAAVTLLHSKVPDISAYTKNADVIVVAAGKPKILTSDMVKKGAVVIDVGINVIDGKLIGDADFDALLPICSYITPVPGGVGPLTIAFLMNNVLTAYQRQHAKT